MPAVDRVPEPRLTAELRDQLAASIGVDCLHASRMFVDETPDALNVPTQLFGNGEFLILHSRTRTTPALLFKSRRHAFGSLKP
jgi:hypothetical protein